MDLKNKFRQEIKNRARSYSSETLKQKSNVIIKSLQEILSPFSGLWAAFKPLTFEPQINFDSDLPHLQWAYPITEQSHLKFKKKVTQWQKSPLGVQEPVDGEGTALTDFEGFIIPCLGLNSMGHRLGRGAGFYDRTFGAAQNLSNKYKIGLCFSDAFTADIPNESHDLVLDVGVTEQGIYFFNNTVKKVFNRVGE